MEEVKDSVLPSRGPLYQGCWTTAKPTAATICLTPQRVLQHFALRAVLGISFPTLKQGESHVLSLG
jgi:hypothetical protein